MSARTADAVTLGDSWLGPAIKAGYLQPLQDVGNFRWWVSLQSQPSLALALASALALTLALSLALLAQSILCWLHTQPSAISALLQSSIDTLYRNAQDTILWEGKACLACHQYLVSHEH